MAVLVCAAAGGGLAARLSTPHIAAILAFALILAIFLWRSMDPMMPFLLLVAAMQGGVLLRVSLSGAPVETLAPLLGGWVVVAILVDRRERARSHPTLVAGRMLPGSLCVLAAIVGVTVAAQAWRSDGRLLDLTEMLTLAQLAVLVLISAYLLRTPKTVLWVGYVTVAAGVLTSIVAMLDLAGLLKTGSELIYFEGYTRVSGLLGDPNFFAYQLLISLAFSLHIAVAARTTPGRVVFWIASGILGAGIVSSYSAGALVGVAVVLVAVVALQLRISSRRILAACVPVVAIAAVVAVIAPAGYTEAITTKYGGLSTSSFEQVGTKRGAAWEAAAREVASNPVVGVGLSTTNTETAIAKWYTFATVERKAAHNTYIGMAVGSGVAGLIAFAAVLASCFSALWASYARTARTEHPEATLASCCLLTALAVVAIQGLQLDLQLDKYLWLLVGSVLAVRHWDLGREITPAWDTTSA